MLVQSTHEEDGETEPRFDYKKNMWPYFEPVLTFSNLYNPFSSILNPFSWFQSQIWLQGQPGGRRERVGAEEGGEWSAKADQQSARPGLLNGEVGPCTIFAHSGGGTLLKQCFLKMKQMKQPASFECLDARCLHIWVFVSSLVRWDKENSAKPWVACRLRLLNWGFASIHHIWKSWLHHNLKPTH